MNKSSCEPDDRKSKDKTKPSSGPDIQKWVKKVFESLLLFADGKLEGCKYLDISIKRPEATKLVMETRLDPLRQLTEKNNVKTSKGNNLSNENVRDALKDYLQEFLGILKYETIGLPTKGNLRLTLTLWDEDTARNLIRFDQVWKEKREKEKPKKEITRSKKSTSIAPDWRQLCLTMLEGKRRIIVDYWLNRADRLRFEQLDFVPLGLLQQKKDQNGRNIDYAVTEKFDTEEQFFHEVLRDGHKSPQSQGRRLAIIGESGAGKTTLLLKIGFWMLDHTDEIPLWIDGRKIGTKPLPEYLEEWLKEASRKRDIPAEWIANLEQRLANGHVCLLLDGVEKQGTHFLEQLTYWVGKWRVVLTCRTTTSNASKAALEVLRFDTYQHLGFRLEQVEQYIDAWFTSDAKQLWAELNQPRYHRIKELVTNPLYLTFLCRTWQPQRQLPSTKAGLIQWFLDTDYDRSIPEPTKPQKQRLIDSLGNLAKQAIEGGESRLSRSLVCNRNNLGESDEDLFLLAIKQLGWLQCVSPDQGVYEFLHDSFKEYFAAKAIPHWHYFLKHVPHNPDRGKYLIFEPQWKEVILLWLGREDVEKEDKEAFIKSLVEFEDGCQDFYSSQACCLGASGIAEFKECKRAKQIVLWLVRFGFSSQTFDAPIGQLARETFPETDRTLAVTALIDTINNRINLCVGYLLVWELGQIGMGFPEAITTLLSLVSTRAPDATHYECNSNHYQAIDSLGQIAFNHSEAIKTLNDLIDSNIDMLTRVKAAECLVKIAPSHKSKAINTLIELSGSEQDTDIRARAAYSLAKIDSQYLEKAIETLSEIIDSYKLFNPKDFRHHLVASRLIEIAPEHPKAIEVALLLETTANYPESITELIDLLGSSADLSICIEAAKKLEKVGIGNDEVVKTLIELIHSNIDSSIRVIVAECLGKILQTHQFELAISSIKDCLCDRVAESDFNLYYNCYKAIWPCSQNMSYPEFYKAWHGLKKD